jgi:hypothetical protein
VIELAHIFRRHGADYQAKFAERMLPSHRLAMQAIIKCRTDALGGHVYHCDHCDEDQTAIVITLAATAIVPSANMTPPSNG